MAVLCINLDEATERWTRTKTAVAAALPNLPLVRIPAVNGRDLDPKDPQLPLSSLCRLRLLERRTLCHHMQIDSVGAVGCFLSHIACWQWLLKEPSAEFALVIEDDICFRSDVADHLDSALALRTRLDYCILGYKTTHDGVPPRRVLVDGLPLYDRYKFEGAHFYLVTKAGARTLLRHTVPLQMHVDLWLGVLMEIGRVRGFVWPVSLASQCRGWVESGIGHFDWEVGLKKMLPDSAMHNVQRRAVLVVVLVVYYACVLWKRKTTD